MHLSSVRSMAKGIGGHHIERGDGEMSDAPAVNVDPSQKMSLKDVYTLYENGKGRRYNLLFSVNGAALAILSFFAKDAERNGVLTGLMALRDCGIDDHVHLDHENGHLRLWHQDGPLAGKPLEPIRRDRTACFEGALHRPADHRLDRRHRFWHQPAGSISRPTNATASRIRLQVEVPSVPVQRNVCRSATMWARAGVARATDILEEAGQWRSTPCRI